MHEKIIVRVENKLNIQLGRTCSSKNVENRSVLRGKFKKKTKL